MSTDGLLVFGAATVVLFVVIMTLEGARRPGTSRRTTRGASWSSDRVAGSSVRTSSWRARGSPPSRSEFSAPSRRPRAGSCSASQPWPW
jgi:hypothetical protein